MQQTNENEPLILHAFSRLAKTKPRLNLAFQHRLFYDQVNETSVDPLYIATYFGFCSLIRHLLGEGSNVNAKGGYYCTILNAAALCGYYLAVLLLLDSGADINAESWRHGTALQAASLRGHHPIVLLLLERGAAVNGEGGKYGNTLQMAARGGYLLVV